MRVRACVFVCMCFVERDIETYIESKNTAERKGERETVEKKKTGKKGRYKND